MPACSTTAPKPDLIYGVGDNELNRLGHRFGYRVEALGMSQWSFTRGARRFYVFAHPDISVRRRLQAGGPVVLTYDPPGRKPPVELGFSVEQGVSYTRVEEQFGWFIKQIDPHHQP